MPEYAELVSLCLFVQTYRLMTATGCQPAELKYISENHNVLASGWTRMTSVGSRSLCGLECEIELYCVAFAFNEHGGECYLYDKDITGEVYNQHSNTNIYISNRKCGSLPTRQNASPELMQPTYPAGARVNYICSSGFNLEGSSQAHCLPSGDWEIPTFTCKAQCGSLPTRPNASPELIQPTYNTGARINYICTPAAGYYLDGSSQAQCLSSGDWHVPTFTCKAAKSCQEAHNLGVTVTPTVIIKPDVNLPAVTVSCEITNSGVYTIIGHGVSNRTHVTGFEAARSFVGTINYNIDLQQVINIADASAECEQYIKFECHGVAITVDVGLNTRTGTLATYLIGGVKGQYDCACHINNACVNGLNCNCQMNDAVSRVDEGYIRYKEDLPITAMLVGDTGDSSEYAYYTIGNLKCKG